MLSPAQQLAFADYGKGKHDKGKDKKKFKDKLKDKYSKHWKKVAYDRVYEILANL